MEDSSAFPPRGERFTETAARAVWAAILALSTAVQHQILEALQDHLARLDMGKTVSAKRRAAVSALREVAGMLGRSPSPPDYRKLRAEHPERGWPPDSNVRTWLGGRWNDCLRLAHLDEIAGDELVVRTLGPAFTVEEIVTALQECAEDVGGPPSFSAYMAWVQRPDVLARRARYPQSHAPFSRAFGGYPAALGAAGFGDSTVLARLTASGATRVHHHGRLRVDTLLDALRLVAKRLGHSPRRMEYERERELIMNEALAEGRVKSVPSLAVFQKRWRSWNDALAAAGLEPPPVVISRAGRVVTIGQLGPQTTDEEALGFLRQACEARGFPLARAQYEAWRKDQLQLDREQKRLRKIPGADSLQQRFGGWDNAQMHAQGTLPAKAPAARPAARDRLRETTEEEVLELLREACAACGYPLAKKTYNQWRLDQLRRDHAGKRIRRIPSSGTIATRFGSWEAAVARATGSPEQAPSLNGTRPVSKAEALEALHQAHEALGFPFSRQDYDDWREAQLERSLGQQEERSLPCSETVRRCLGGWRQALALTVGRRADAGAGRMLTDDAALEFLRRAADAVGFPLSRDAYDGWRKAEIEQGLKEMEQRRIPCSETLRFRFGGWQEALARLLEQGYRPEKGRSDA